MRTVGDYYSTIQQAEKTRQIIIDIMQEINNGDSHFLALQQACAFIRAYVEELKKKEVRE